MDFDFALGTVIQGGGTLLVVSFDPINNPSALSAFRQQYQLSPAQPIVGPYSGRLANDSDEIELRRPDTPNSNNVPYILVERVRYFDTSPWPTSADGAGLSLTRVSNTGFANDATNWVAAAPTPGPAAEGSDSDGDGLPDNWEIQYGLNPSNPADANQDADGDGATNLQEYLAGTNPVNPASVLRIVNMQKLSPNHVLLTFYGVSNRTYTVEYKDALSEPVWSHLLDVGAASFNRAIQINTIAPSDRFYRVRTP